GAVYIKGCRVWQAFFYKKITGTWQPRFSAKKRWRYLGGAMLACWKNHGANRKMGCCDACLPHLA
ncbi:hypothetical protein THS27_26365, partial [Thalassospira sp. MCCC 1A01428]